MKDRDKRDKLLWYGKNIEIAPVQERRQVWMK